MALREVLHVLFGITVDMGTLARGEVMSYEKHALFFLLLTIRYLPNYENDIPVLLRILNLPIDFANDPLLYDVKLSVMNCFVNIPIDYMRVLVVLGDKDTTLNSLFDLIEYEMATTDE